MENGQMINEFLLELSDLLEKYSYTIVAVPTSVGHPMVGIKTTHPHSENLYVDDLTDKDSISRYF